MAKALGDLKILEVAEGWSAPLCSKLLAELGAEVIKVEPPGGDRLRHLGPYKDVFSYAFSLANAQKKSIVLDLGHQQDHRRCLDLVANADILIESYSPGHLASLGLGYEEVKRSNPGLIYCSITPYGQTGPLRDLPASELTVQALSGFMAGTGFADDPPTKAGVGIGELGAALFAAIGILAALHYRDRTGTGQFVDIAQRDCLLAYEVSFLPQCLGTGRCPQRIGNYHVSAAPWNSYQTADGWVVITTTSEAHFRILMELVGRKDMADSDKYRTRNQRAEGRQELDEAISQWTMKRTVDEVVSTLEAIGLAVSPIATIEQLLTNEHSLSRDMVVYLDHPEAGRIPTSGPLSKLSETPGIVDRPAPTLGADQNAVFSSHAAPTGVARSAQGNENKPGGAPDFIPIRDFIGGALEGIRVIEMAHAAAGPFAGRILGTLGADVIKVEPPKGDSLRPIEPAVNGVGLTFTFYNTDKRGVVLDLEKEHDRQALRYLLARADVCLENLAPDALASKGFSYQAMNSINPRIVYASVKGFGLTGPWADKKAFDMVTQAVSGIMSLTGQPDKPPVKMGPTVADALSGTFACVAILAALHYARKTGRGQLIDVSMHDVNGWMTQQAWPIYFATGQSSTRCANRSHFYAPHNSYPAKDGIVAIAVETDEQWRGLVAATGMKSLLGGGKYHSPEERLAHSDEIDEIVSQWTRGLPIAEVTEACRRLGVPAGQVLELDEAISHPATRARSMIVPVHHPRAGDIPVPDCPINLSLTPVMARTPAPDLGQHTEEILRQLRETPAPADHQARA